MCRRSTYNQGSVASRDTYRTCWIDMRACRSVANEQAEYHGGVSTSSAHWTLWGPLGPALPKSTWAVT